MIFDSLKPGQRVRFVRNTRGGPYQVLVGRLATIVKMESFGARLEWDEPFPESIYHSNCWSEWCFNADRSGLFELVRRNDWDEFLELV